MKKLFLVTAILLLMTAPGFAATMGQDQSGTFSAGWATGVDTLSCGLSNNVHAVYYTDGTAAAPAQWYAIGTYHIGGTEVYATAQDITSIYKLKAGKTPGNNFTWTGMPTDSGNSNIWSSGVWEQL